MGSVATFALFLIEEIVPLAMRAMPAAVEALNDGRDMLRNMVEEDRDPTPEEWLAVNLNLAELRKRLHAHEA